eukprot:NODE_2815_length_2139_cov_11.221173.p1 GENE.NODE_2815_length_2139_cov_11.221173~~NODE_2815_length_2139_cov_11.221173.p1  ORF type:complete len:619 (+),score=151.13 NODE_2815_length_2139_cov_11.221173:237-1859(+)
MSLLAPLRRPPSLDTPIGDPPPQDNCSDVDDAKGKLEAVAAGQCEERVRKHRVNRDMFHCRRPGDVRASYTWTESDELGRGSFGRVYSARSVLDPKRVVAVKQIARKNVEDIEGIWTEMRVLHTLDHPNVLRLIEAFEDGKCVYFVTELCHGGSLQHWLPKMTGNVQFARRVICEIARCVAHCHTRGICHRDLKLENMLLVRNASDSPVRVADFGLAKQSVRHHLKGMPTPLSKGNLAAGIFRSCHGTPEYFAPEVLRIVHERTSGLPQEASYDFRIDVWSLGVMLVQLLTGAVPYSLETLATAIVNGAEELPPVSLPSVKDEHACDFAQLALRFDYRKRPEAGQLLRHAWLAEFAQLNFEELEVKAMQPVLSENLHVLKRRLSIFENMSDFKRAVLIAAARHLHPYEFEQLREVFERLDRAGTGEILVSDLRTVLQHLPDGHLSSSRIDETYLLDMDQNGTIDFTEFLAATMDSNIEDNPSLVRAAFQDFDTEGSGVISRGTLLKVLSVEATNEVMKRAQLEGERDITIAAFIELLRLG